jgi:hypothetical protein
MHGFAYRAGARGILVLKQYEGTSQRYFPLIRASANVTCKVTHYFVLGSPASFHLTKGIIR